MDLQANSKKTVQSSAGAADQELFIKEFEEIPRRQFILLNSLEDNLQTVKFNLENVHLDWSKRIEALQTFRSILIDLTNLNLIVNSLKDLENSFQLSLKDLRSKVVREACITIAFTSVRLQNKCEKFIETLLPLLFNLTQNSAKIMSTSAVVAIRFIIQNTQSSKFIPIIHHNLNSKSKEIRRYCCDFLNQLLRTWSKSILEKNIKLLQEDIKKGLNDADPEARSFSRKAFWMLDYHFKEKANQLFFTLDSNKRRLLENEKMADLNINQIDCLDGKNKPVAASKPRLQPAIKRFAKPKNIPASEVHVQIFSPQRTVSSVDLETIRKATMKNEQRNLAFTPVQFAAAKTNSSSSIKENNANFENTRTPTNERLQQLRKPISSIPKSKLLTAQPFNRSSIKTTPLNRITRSQPGSRSTSPSLRSAYLNDLSSPFGSDLSSCSNSKLNKKSAIPVITARQTSIEDYTNSPLMNRSFKNNGLLLNSNRKLLNLDYQSDASDVSSICSNKSFSERQLEDINDIIRNLNSTNWPNKKDGLISLEHFIYHSTTTLNEDQLRLLTDIFTKMLLDPNTKTLSLVLSVLNTFIIHFHNEISYWLYILLTRLFLKTGSDILASIQKRIIKTFETITNSFQKSQQFNVLIQFISDNKLTPILKVKITALQYLINLILQMDPSDLNCKEKKYNKEEFEKFLIKIITWSEDKKSAQLRTLSQDIILELFNLNTSEFCNIASQLPSNYWDVAYGYVKKVSISNSNNYKKQVEDSVIFSQSFYDQISKFSFNKNEDLNQTAIFDSLMKTTEEINRFTSGLTTDLNDTEENERTDLDNHSVNDSKIMRDDYQDERSIYKTSEIESEKKASSMDSGISQLDCTSSATTTATTNNYNKSSTSATNSLSANKLSPEPKENNDNSSGSDLTTYNSFKSVNSFYVTTTTSMKNYSQAELSDQTIDNNRKDNSNNHQTNNEELNEINNNYERCLTSLEDLSLSFDEKKIEQLLKRLESKDDDKLRSIEELNNLILNNDYKKYLEPHSDLLLRILIDQISKKELILRQLSIKTFSNLINEFRDCFVEKQLICCLDKLLYLTKQDYKELNSSIQHCTDTISQNFKINSLADYLVKIIDKGEFPSNESSIKLLTKLIKHSDEETVNKIVPKIIPCIVKSNDNAITSVRKFSIFCLVELFNKVGMVIKPYLSSLDSSKIKLLKIYIDDSKSARSSSPLLER